MAQPASSYSSYDAVGNREDLANAIYDISPTTTPFLNGIKKNSAASTKHEWQTDSLAAASGSNFVIEGDDASTDASSATTRVYNYTAISDKVARVTGTQEAINSAGRQSEMAYQVMKRSKELKRDVETILLSNNAAVAGNDTTARECAGVESWLATNTDRGGTGVDPTGDGTDAATDGTQRAFAESQLQSVIASCWENGGEPDTIMVGAFNKQALSAFTGNASRQINADDKKLVTDIRVYVSDFGDLVVIPNRFQRTRSALVLDMDMWCFSTLRDFQTVDLAKTGDTERKQILVEYTLESKNEAASGIIADLTTA
jgi:hypothetical protein